MKIGRLEITFYNQWQPLYRRDLKWNWVDLTVIDLKFEVDPIFCLFRIDCGLLGLLWGLSYQYKKPDNDDYHEVMNSFKEMKEKYGLDIGD